MLPPPHDENSLYTPVYFPVSDQTEADGEGAKQGVDGNPNFKM